MKDGDDAVGVDVNVDTSYCTGSVPTYFSRLNNLTDAILLFTIIHCDFQPPDFP